MSYQVLARTWRPKKFVDVVGQQHVLTALANGLSLGRVHHAYLFSGTRGVGKTTIARILAKGLNCEVGITATPCEQCASCREIESGRFVDLLEIDAASRTKVEDTRELLGNVQYAPTRGRFKVYLIDEIHMLSRHSFNALLKTLEEPPSHVKFLLATTDPQKLPATILSRCLQFHLNALDVEQIHTQLNRVLQTEQIIGEPRALQLLARAADGSMRDALSLADQAIAIGQGQVTTATVSQMLGALDDEQPLAIIEALVSADGAQVMAQVEQAALRGVNWENLLVETLGLLHRIAMLQLLPAMLDNHYTALEPRLRALARLLPPTDLQLYYQILLVGRKELAYAPDRRMGVEMSLLRALAFHPKVVIPAATNSSPDVPLPPPTVAPPPLMESAPQPISVAVPAVAPVDLSPEVMPPSDELLPDPTTQLLQARAQLLRQQGKITLKKKSKPVSPKKALSANTILKQLPSATGQGPNVIAGKPSAKEAYRWQAQHQPVVAPARAMIPKALRSALAHEKTPELAAKLVLEAAQRDPWAADIERLSIPKLVQQLALNTFKQQVAPGHICLHLRSAQRHLNSPAAQKVLADALSELYDSAVRLNVVEDDNLAERTPLEWRQAIYGEKLAQARQSIIADNHIQALQRLFDADLDEESIQPI